MKKLFIILLLVSCSKSKEVVTPEPTCKCQKITYNASEDILFEDVPCQNPIREIPLNDNLWFRVECK